MTDSRIIKKYPNRRLYDTEISRYVTLDDIRLLVLEEVPFRIRDAKTNQDITRSILLQIIMEREEGGEPIFSEKILEQVIRFYGDSMQGMITGYLERSVRLFAEQQDRFHEQMSSVVGNDPLSLMQEMTEKNLSIWQDVQKSFFAMSKPANTDGSGRSKRRKS